MNGHRLMQAGWPEGPLIGQGLAAARALGAEGLDADTILAHLEAVRAQPDAYLEDSRLGALALAWQRHMTWVTPPYIALRDEGVPFNTWGAAMIDHGALTQMQLAARLPVARAGALMADAHSGYGLPIGGVLATENAVIPYAVGVDIACRMRLTVFEESPHRLDEKRGKFEKALLNQTRFGVGAAWAADERPEHAVLDDPDWKALGLLRKLKDKAWAQLGTSGTGNHFVEFGQLEALGDDPELGLTGGKKYLALLSHSGSRGIGAAIANEFTELARQHCVGLDDQVRHLAWLSLDSEEGQSYWLAMELAGRYASANHEVIHMKIAEALHLRPVSVVENHHNFAWRETLADGTSVVVHRKGATPAGPGVLGVIPGSMGDPGYVVRGRGIASALNSASHGAGRRMGRREAARRLDPERWHRFLHERGISLIGGTIDESPQAYKPIDEVMAAQRELVEPVARFLPRLVRMAEEAGDT